MTLHRYQVVNQLRLIMCYRPGRILHHHSYHWAGRGWGGGTDCVWRGVGSWVGHKPSQGSVPLVCLGSSLAQSQWQSWPGCVPRVVSWFEGEQSAVDQVLTCSVLDLWSLLQPASSTLLLSGHSAFMPSSFTFWDLLPPSHRTSGALPEWPLGSCSHLLWRTFSQFSQCGCTTSEESCFFFQIYSISEWWRAMCSRQHSVPQTFAKIQKEKKSVYTLIPGLFLFSCYFCLFPSARNIWKGLKTVQGETLTKFINIQGLNFGQCILPSEGWIKPALSQLSSGPHENIRLAVKSQPLLLARAHPEVKPLTSAHMVDKSIKN